MDRDGEAELAHAASWVGLPGLDAGPVDHAWLYNGHGVLCCVAGHRHATDAVAVCPYYLRTDVVDQLPGHLRATGELPAPLRYSDGLFYKVTGLVRPERWHDLAASLPTSHGLRPCAWSVFSALDPMRVVAGHDPRDALRTVLAATDSGLAVDLLARLVAGLGDPGNEHGSVGLTGSIALAPERIGRAGDIDLLLYLPAVRRAEVDVVLRGLGARFLADLVAGDDPRLGDYCQSRVMAPVCRPTSREVFWSRRRDVAWVGEQRIDLTWAESHAAVEPELPYERPPARPYRGELRVRAVSEQFPVLAEVDGPEGITGLHITARGLQDSLLRGDLVTVAGSLHHDHDGGRFVSVDDAAGHHLDLTT